MNPTFDAVLRSWPFEPWVVFPLLLTALLYTRGWRQLHRRDAERWPPSLLAAFLGGLVVLFVALASPLEPFTSFLLQAHMAQHLLLMMAAPPLLWLGAPLFPLLRGLPREIRLVWAVPLLRWRPLRRMCIFLTRPAPALCVFVGLTWLWHFPAVYELAQRSPGWHYVQHACFLGGALLFWYPVVQPYPSRPAWSRWLLMPYLILADVQNTALSALLTFADRPWYPAYTQVPRLGNLSALEDQTAAGVLMWVPGSLAFLLPLFWIGLQMLYGRETAHKPAKRIALPLANIASPISWDILRLPLLGRFLKWRHARLALQVPLLVLAVLVALNGFRGPQISAMNLAGVLPWVHWRGLVVFGLLAVGNVFCLACPFTAPRTLARRLRRAHREWPSWLRNKWLAVGLLALFFWSYEAFALWDSPWLTAWIIAAYFLAALLVDGIFRGAAFCKYVCPIGQFNFVQSLVSPWEIKTREPAVCASCATKGCIRGRGTLPGCELDLFLPRKAGNFDCTMCLDCVHACPHDNVGWIAVMPGQELWPDPSRSGIGRFSQRPDVAALILVLVFGAFANAAGMVGPVVDGHERLAANLGLTSPFAVITASYALALLVVPLVTVGMAAAASRRWGGLPGGFIETATTFSYALIPLGFGMWLSHYSFHFLTSYDAAWPTWQRFVYDLGWVSTGSINWVCACCRPLGAWLLRLEIVFLDLGVLLSLYTVFQIAQRRAARPLLAFLPWSALLVGLFALGTWIIFQPMQMRGTLAP